MDLDLARGRAINAGRVEKGSRKKKGRVRSKAAEKQRGLNPVMGMGMGTEGGEFGSVGIKITGPEFPEV